MHMAGAMCHQAMAQGGTVVAMSDAFTVALVTSLPQSLVMCLAFSKGWTNGLVLHTQQQWQGTFHHKRLL